MQQNVRELSHASPSVCLFSFSPRAVQTILMEITSPSETDEWPQSD